MIDDKFSEIVKENNITGAVLVVAEKGLAEVFYRGFLDKANTEPITSASIFPMASLTKIFIGFTCARLVLEEKINIDEKILNTNITLRELLTHTSGLPKLLPSIKDSVEPYKGVTESEISFFTENFTYKDRGRYLYSNLGFGLIGLYLEKKLNTSLNQILTNFLFEPAGMNSSVILPEKFKGKTVTGYDRTGCERKHWSSGLFVASGGMWANTEDLLKFFNFLQTNELGNQIFNEATKPLATFDDLSIGYGMHIWDNVIISQDGSNYGVYNKLRINKESKKIALLLTSLGSDCKVADELLERIILD